jgi:hypothetical protein
VEVIEHQHQRLTLGGTLEKCGDGIKETEAALFWIVQRRRHVEVGELVPDLWYEFRDHRGLQWYLGIALRCSTVASIGA